jgi:hypothetical protein
VVLVEPVGGGGGLAACDREEAAALCGGDVAASHETAVEVRSLGGKLRETNPKLTAPSI